MTRDNNYDNEWRGHRERPVHYHENYDRGSNFRNNERNYENREGEYSRRGSYGNSGNNNYGEGSPSGRQSGNDLNWDARQMHERNRQHQHSNHPSQGRNYGHENQHRDRSWEAYRNREPQHDYDRWGNNSTNSEWNNHDRNHDGWDDEDYPYYDTDPHYRRAHNFSQFGTEAGFGYSTGGYGPDYYQSGRPYMSREEIEYERAHPHHHKGFFGQLWDAVAGYPEEGRDHGHGHHHEDHGHHHNHNSRNNDRGNNRWNDDRNRSNW